MSGRAWPAANASPIASRPGARVPTPRSLKPFRTTNAQGTGLGLSIAKGIVGGHGERIAAANRPGCGAEAPDAEEA